MLKDKNDSFIISYLTLRKVVGILGILLPFICMLDGVQESLSFYYHTDMRDLFVGILIGVCLFLVTYKGYEKRDNIVTSISGFAGFAIALFPCRNLATGQPVGFFQINPDTSNTIHGIAAAVFFVFLAINSFFLFTLSNRNPASLRTKNKNIRNIIYRVCGGIIFALLILIVVIGQDNVQKARLLLPFETAMLVAFGISWLVKGETLLRD